MIKRLYASGLMLLLAACDSVSSDQPLFAADASSARQGLWALLENDSCPVPQDARVQDWPSCSTPVWVSASSVTYLFSGPIRQDVVVSTGQPWIAQLAPPQGGVAPFVTDSAPTGPLQAGAEPGRYTYLALKPEGPAPFSKARVWQLPCPGLDEPLPREMSRADDGACLAGTTGAVRSAAAYAMNSGPGYRAVWVAEAP